MSGAGADAVVVGGGVIGAACAHYLALAGYRVTILEKGAFGDACSRGNCGLVCPSHVLPLAEPGALREALRALLKPNAPFRIKPRPDPALWIWLWNFARRCNARAMVEAGRCIQPLLESSLALYGELVEMERLECEWQRKGLLFVYRSRRPMEAYAETNALLEETFQTPAVRCDGEALKGLEPALKSGLAGGWYYERDAHLRPESLMRSWRARLESRGVTVREQCEFLGFVPGRAGEAAGVRTSQGELACGAAVVAAGAFTPGLREQLGCRIPIQPGKGYSVTMPRPARCPAIPLILPEERVAVTPMLTGYRLGSIMEFAGYDATLPPQRLALLERGARPYLEEPAAEPVLERWYGWRPMTWDGLPILDRSPRYGNVLIAAGHNMLGLSMAPATGRLAAEILAGTDPHIDPSPYRLARFA